MFRFDQTAARPEDPEEAFAYFADLSNAAAWDPGVRCVQKLTPGPVQAGTRFRVESALLGGANVEYEVTACEVPRFVELTASTDGFRATDRISFEAVAGGGCRVRYESRVAFAAASSRVESLRTRLFHSVARAAMTGLAQAVLPDGSPSADTK